MDVKKNLILIVTIIMFIKSGFAQIVPPPMPPPPPPGLLIDGYTVLLFIVGLIYGVKKIYK
ncbi:hypothetical protein BTO04_13475 [Polaribacter sp. SA4-10]|nr:hypothetical protein BTO04_13475 [Polaribacter sp. SA4-10]